MQFTANTQSMFDAECTMGEVYMMYTSELDMHYWSSCPETRDNYDCPDSTGWSEFRIRNLAAENPDGTAARAMAEADGVAIF